MGPLNISVKGDYALRAILDLAGQRSGEPVKIAAIAKRQQIPQKFLELILAGLKQGGFVESKRGADGGYLLARPADSVSVGEVLRHVEGGRRQRPGPGRGENPFAPMWASVEQAVSEILDRTTFAELARQWRDKQSKYVPTWDI
ncbi:MAG: Rrf2 family transcriptional regulator [Bryobacteraceae bacterium]